MSREALRPRTHVNDGNWDKILKRMYGLAVKVDSDILESRVLGDLIANPELDERIFTYFSKRNRFAELFSLFSSYSEAGESLSEATEVAFPSPGIISGHSLEP